MKKTKIKSMVIETTDQELQSNLTEKFNSQEPTDIYIGGHRMIGKVKQMSDSFSTLKPAEDTPFTAHIEATETKATEQADLYGFVHWLFTNVWPHGDADGGDLQDMGVKFGILKPEEVTERCGEYCRCAEWNDFPQTCYRLSLTAKPEPEATK